MLQNLVVRQMFMWRTVLLVYVLPIWLSLCDTRLQRTLCTAAVYGTLGTIKYLDLHPPSLQQHHGHALDTLQVAMVVLGTLGLAMPHVGLKGHSQIVASAVLSCGALALTRVHDSAGWFLGEGGCEDQTQEEDWDWGTLVVGKVSTGTGGLGGVLDITMTEWPAFWTFWVYNCAPILPLLCMGLRMLLR